MRVARPWLLLVLTFGLGATDAAAAADGRAASAGETLFVNGTLLTMSEPDRVRADLRVVDQHIDEIGSGLEPGPDATVIDMRGGYLMPGLTEMHAHVPAPNREQAENWTQYRDDVLFLWVANGVTTVRGMLGHPAHLNLREALENHEVLGPRLITAGPSFNGDSVSGPAQARKMARDQAAAGYDFLKIHPGLSREEYDAVATEARRLGVRFAGHVPKDVGLLHAIAAGQATVDHLDGFMQALAGEPGGGLFGVALASRADPSRLDALAAAMREAGTAVVPTETLVANFAAADRPDRFLDRPEAAYLPPRLRNDYRERLNSASGAARAAREAADVRRHIIAELHRAQVDVLLGSDAPQVFNVPGFSLHGELEALVTAGLTPEEALRAGTVEPARHLGLADEFGQLRPGLAADLVMLSADPTADIGNVRAIEGVMVRGRWLDRRALDAGLAAIAERNAETVPAEPDEKS